MGETTVQTADGLHLDVCTEGPEGAPNVVLIHGFPDDRHVWDPLVAELRDRFRVTSYDVRGAGRSSAPTTTDGYHMDHLMDDLEAVLDVVAPEGRIHLVGHDWGSIQGWEAATDPRFEGRLASYTSISAPGIDMAAAWLRRRSLASLRQLAHSGYIAVFQIPGVERLLAPGMRRNFRTVLERVEGVRTDPTFPGPHLERNARNGVGLYRANMMGRVRDPRPRPAHVPVQLVVAHRDRYVLPELAQGAPAPHVDELHVRHVNAGHWLVRTHATLLARWIEEFVRSREGAGAAPDLERSRAVPPGPLGSPRPPVPTAPVAVVTGGGSGIGRSTVVALAAKGHRVVVADLDEAAARATVDAVTGLGGGAVAYRVDVGDAEAMERFADWVLENEGTPDVVVNNAGIGMAGGAMDTTPEDWERILSVNLRGVVNGSRVFGRLMVERGVGGHIVNVASAAAFSPSRAFAAYATSKAAVVTFTESLAGELDGEGIHVCTVCPGFTNTPLVHSTIHVGRDEEQQARLRARAARQYRRRNLGPDTVAAAIVAGVEQRRPLVLVGGEAHLARFLHRFTPRLQRAAARIPLSGGDR